MTTPSAGSSVIKELGMKKRIFSFVIAALLLLSLCSCSLRLNNLNYDKTANTFTDKSTGITYTDIPFCYEPVALGEEYAKWNTGEEKVIFYEIPDAEPTVWLAEEGMTVFLNTAHDLPDLRGFKPSGVIIVVEEVIQVSLAVIEKAEDIEALVAAWENGEAVELPGAEPTLSYSAKFTSEEYPWLYYKLVYVEYADGARYLYDRESGRCVDAGEVIAAYLAGTADGNN